MTADVAAACMRSVFKMYAHVFWQSACMSNSGKLTSFTISVPQLSATPDSTFTLHPLPGQHSQPMLRL